MGSDLSDLLFSCSQIVRLVSPFNGELSFIMATVLWSDRFVNKKLQRSITLKEDFLGKIGNK